MRRVTILTNNDDFYEELLLVLKCKSPVKELRPKELKILAFIMRRYNELSALAKEDRYANIFSKKGKELIRGHVGISLASLENNLSILKKHRLLMDNKYLNPSLEGVMLNNKFNLEFIFRNDRD